MCNRYCPIDKTEKILHNPCLGKRVQCKKCGRLHHECLETMGCPKCSCIENTPVPWWYGMPLPAEGSVFGKKLINGREVIPKYFVAVRAFLNPAKDGDSVTAWLAAEKYFRDRGFTWVTNEEFDSHDNEIMINGIKHFANL